MLFLRSRRMKIVQPFGKSASGSRLRLSLCDTNANMTDAWLEAFFGVEAVEILQGDLMETSADAVVSPANSFGDMGGGVDKRIDDHYRGAAQEAVIACIAQEFLGELPVGMALIVPIPKGRPPFVIAAPTMRVPQNVADTLNAYLAMRAVLVTLAGHNTQHAAPIRTVAVPGLCTGVGGMPCTVAARQMRAAYDNVVDGRWKEVLHPAMAPFAMANKTVGWR
jgi:O-acetyl-ADP-ribose deacetylase (regulator of RNase III)